MPIRYGTSSDDDMDLGSGTWIAYGLDGNDRIASHGRLGNSGFPFYAPTWIYSGDDQLFGMDGDDVISSGEGDDVLRGGNDNDILDGSIGDDELLGESGDDLLILAFGNDVYNGGSGYDILDASLVNSFSAGGTGLVEISDDPGADDEVPLLVDREVGVDLNLRTGAAFFRETDGTRSDLMGTSSFVAIEEFQLTTFGDRFVDDGGSHTVLLGDGDDIFFGGEGDDIAFGGNDDDELNGEGGNDLLFGDGGADVLDGGDGFDRLEGGSGTDSLFGGIGNDELVGGTGADVLDGEDGVDLADYRLSNAAVSVSLLDFGSGGSGTGGHAQGDILFRIENVTGSNFSDTLIGDAGDNRLEGLNGNDTLTGGDGRDTLIGGIGADTLNGGSGNDSLDGGDNNDTLNGGTGADTMSGGLGDDTYTVDNAADFLIELSNAGTDTVKASVSYTLGANQSIEFLTTTNAAGTTAINLTGNNLANQIIGNAGINVLNGGGSDDTIDGRGGADTMLGGTGNDRFIVDSSGDIVTENAGEGSDTVQVSVNYVLGAGAEIETLETTNAGATVNLDLVGNEFGNTIIGNNGQNTLVGGLGLDTLIGNGGGDVFAWRSTAETGATVGTADVVGADFDPLVGDLLAFNLIDANETLAGDQAFTFVGAGAFTAAGQISTSTFGGDTLILLNTDNDAGAEAVIRVLGIHTVDASWFVL